MKKLIIFFFLALPSLMFSQKVGLDILNPSSKFHIHDANPIDNISNNIQLTNFSSGTTVTDGTRYGQNGILNFEASDFSFYTNAIERLRILANGKIGMNTSSMIGQSDFVIRSLNSNGFGGMYVESTNSSAGLPFYGYALNGSARAFHYYSPFQSAWVLNVAGDKFYVNNSGQISNKAIPEQSAILDISSQNRGFLPPRMDFLARTNISNPADGLLVYDSTTHDLFVFEDEDWSNLSFWQPYKVNGYSYFGGPIGVQELTITSLTSQGGSEIIADSQGNLVKKATKNVVAINPYQIRSGDPSKLILLASGTELTNSNQFDYLLAPVLLPTNCNIDSIIVFFSDANEDAYLNFNLNISPYAVDDVQSIPLLDDDSVDQDFYSIEKWSSGLLNIPYNNEMSSYSIFFFARYLPGSISTSWFGLSLRSILIYYSY